jgi:DNA anti-recombination protein RmuC
MKSTLSLIAVAGALACGLTLARPVQDEREPLERLEALEKQVGELKSELATLRKAATPAAGVASPEEALRADLEQALRWIQTQSQAADALNAALEESRAKGFTAGINPDSRNALLAGFAELTKAMKTPLVLSAKEPKPATPAKAAAGRPAQR